MKNTTQSRESAKAKEIANEYRRKGFIVTLEPKESDLPRELKFLDFQPDIIAISEETKLVIEVKTFESIKDPALIELAEKIKSVEGWEFELIFTNPRSKNNTLKSTESSTFINVRESLNRAARFLDTDAGKEYSDAALLLIWSAVEGVLRENYKTYRSGDKNINPKALIRDSVMLGIIGKEEQNFLESMVVKRNEFSHGLHYYTVPRRDLEKLINLGRHLADQVA